MSDSTRFGRAETDKPFRPETSANDPREIVIRPNWNVRKDLDSPRVREHIDTIKASILARVNADPTLPGLIKPIEVSYDPATGKHTLEDGQCRLIACRELWDEGHEIYVPNIRVKGDEAQLYAQHIAGNGGLPLTQVELADGCRKLRIGYLWTPEMIAAHICKPKRFVTDCLALAEVPQEAKQMVANGQVTAPRVLSEIRKAEKAHEPATMAVESLKQAVAAAPKPKEPARTRLPETGPIVNAPKAKPLAREKAGSPTDKLLQLADELAYMIVNDNQSIDKVIATARKYLKARNK
jgi:ParB-like chromosome segregation protein Spo0J